MSENNENSENIENHENNENIQPESRPEPEVLDSAEAEQHDQDELDLEQDDEDSLELEPHEEEPFESESHEEEPFELEEDQEPTPEDEEKPPSRFKRWLRKGLIGLAIVAIIFLAGFLTYHFVRYVPLSQELDETRVELEQTNEEVSELQRENDRLTTAYQSAEREVADLEEELEAATANLKFYQVLVNVNTARLELFLENIEGAQEALVDTQDNLEDLLPYIEEVDAELALSLPRRLELIISGLERDPETARVDLELLTKDLLELEPLLVEE